MADQVETPGGGDKFFSSEVIKDYTERDYRTVWQKPRAQFEDRFEGRIMDRMMPGDPGWFIDLGGGYGRLYERSVRPGRKVVLVDYADNLLAMAEERYGDRPDLFYVAADAYHLPFRDSSFSAGVTVRVFHHMNQPESFLRELARVMREGAAVLFEYSNKRNLMRILKRGRRSLRRDHEEYADWQFGTHPAYLRQAAADAGLWVEGTRGTAFFPRYLTERTMFLEKPLAWLETLFDATLGRIGLAPMNFALMRRRGATGERGNPADELLQILCCPSCRGSLASAESGLACESCRRSYSKRGKVIDLRLRS